MIRTVLVRRLLQQISESCRFPLLSHRSRFRFVCQCVFIPQFLGSQPIRVAHGFLVAAGCLWMAAGLWHQSHKG